MTFYTDPSYFAKLWAEEMEKHIKENKSEVKARRKRRPHEPKTNKPIKQAVANTRYISGMFLIKSNYVLPLSF